MDFKGTGKPYKRICLVNPKIMNTKEREVSKYIILAELLTLALMQSLITLQQRSENRCRKCHFLV